VQIWPPPNQVTKQGHILTWYFSILQLHTFLVGDLFTPAAECGIHMHLLGHINAFKHIQLALYLLPPPRVALARAMLMGLYAWFMHDVEKEAIGGRQSQLHASSSMWVYYDLPLIF
jgi:hypothetical protein